MFMTRQTVRRRLPLLVTLALLTPAVTACQSSSSPLEVGAAVDAINNTISSIKAESEAWRDQVASLADELKGMEDKVAKDAQAVVTNTANDVHHMSVDLVEKSSDAIEARIAQGTSELMCGGDWLKDGVTEELQYLRDALRFWDSKTGSKPQPPPHRTCWVSPNVVPIYQTSDHWSADASAFDKSEPVVHIYGYNFDDKAMPTLTLTDGQGNVLSATQATPSYSTRYLLNVDLSNQAFSPPQNDERLTVSWPDGHDPTTINVVRRQPAQLKVVDASLNPSTPRVGERTTLRVALVNTGDVDSDGFDVGFTTDEDSVPVPGKHVTSVKPNAKPEIVESDPFKYKTLGPKQPAITVPGVSPQVIPTTVLPPLTGVLETGDTCDKIRYDVQPGQAGPGDVAFTLRADGVSWWKQIDVPTVGGHSASLAMQDGKPASKTIPVSQLDPSRPFRFWKAKAFGIHTQLGYTWQGLSPQYVDPLAGSAITLTWTRDSC